MPLKTSQIPDLIGCTYGQLIGALRARKFPLPPKDSSGDFVWDKVHIDAARRAIAIDMRLKENRRKAVSA